jgi:hypothetical protein
LADRYRGDPEGGWRELANYSLARITYRHGPELPMK